MASVPLICPFCHQEGEFSYRDVLMEDDYYKCNHCPNRVSFVMYGALMVATMKIIIKNRFYNIDLWLPDFECAIHETNRNGDWLGEILEFKFVPADWNPTNIEVKLRTALTFL